VTRGSEAITGQINELLPLCMEGAIRSEIQTILNKRAFLDGEWKKVTSISQGGDA